LHIKTRGATLTPCHAMTTSLWLCPTHLKLAYFIQS
jgi:hypothetical protein